MIEVNELQKRRVIGKLQQHLGALVGKRVALLGLAFKPNTDDMREASSLVLAARLQADGRQRARLRPGRRGAGARAAARASTSPTRRWTRVEGADAVVLVTEWPEFAELDWREVASAMRGNLVIVTGATRSTARRCARAGLAYEGIGR